MEQAGGGSAQENSGSYLVRRRPARVRGPLIASLAAVSSLAVAGLLLSGTLSNPNNPAASGDGGTGSGAQPAAKVVQDAYPLYTCRGYSSLPRDNPRDQVVRDEFAWGRFKAVKVGDGRGNIDWEADPYKQVSWRMWFHSLRWLGSAINASDPEGLRHAAAIAQDWVRDHPYSWDADPVAQEPTMHRTNTLLCLRQALAQQAGGSLPAEYVWLDAALQDHARSLEAHFSKRGNHGTDEAVALLGVGCTLNLPHYTDLAVTRLGNYLNGSIDEQGATDEQSTGYGYFNRTLWAAAHQRMALCAPSSPTTDRIGERVALLAEFVAHATTPLGPLQQIGNTQFVTESPIKGTPQQYAATGGEVGSPPQDRVKVYDAGYVFGRSGWGTKEMPFKKQSAYSLRFGPQRTLHGHDDHTSITWQARGYEILRDTGYGEYTRDQWEAYAKSPQAHNQLVVSGQGVALETRLTRSDTRTGFGEQEQGTADSFTLADEALAGVPRARDVIVLSDPDIVVTVDRATAPDRRTFTQYWQLPAGRQVEVGRTRTSVTASVGDTRTTLVQLPYRDEKLPTGTATVVAGGTNPIRGWHWQTIFKRVPASTVTFTSEGTSTAMVTAVVAGPAKGRVTTSTRRDGANWIYRFDIAGTVAEVGLTPAGTLWRVS
ncbi:MAG: heparinase II/III family protein [Dermatophilus congolensis]|nr:heparinase II/III family protein [Dermatophilus congolensis]